MCLQGRAHLLAGGNIGESHHTPQARLVCILLCSAQCVCVWGGCMCALSIMPNLATHPKPGWCASHPLLLSTCGLPGLPLY